MALLRTVALLFVCSVLSPVACTGPVVINGTKLQCTTVDELRTALEALPGQNIYAADKIAREYDKIHGFNARPIQEGALVEAALRAFCMCGEFIRTDVDDETRVLNGAFVAKGFAAVLGGLALSAESYTAPVTRRDLPAILQLFYCPKEAVFEPVVRAISQTFGTRTVESSVPLPWEALLAHTKKPSAEEDISDSRRKEEQKEAVTADAMATITHRLASGGHGDALRHWLRVFGAVALSPAIVANAIYAGSVHARTFVFYARAHVLEVVAALPLPAAADIGALLGEEHGRLVAAAGALRAEAPALSALVYPTGKHSATTVWAYLLVKKAGEGSMGAGALCDAARFLVHMGSHAVWDHVLLFLSRSVFPEPEKGAEREPLLTVGELAVLGAILETPRYVSPRADAGLYEAASKLFAHVAVHGQLSPILPTAWRVDLPHPGAMQRVAYIAWRCNAAVSHSPKTATARLEVVRGATTLLYADAANSDALLDFVLLALIVEHEFPASEGGRTLPLEYRRTAALIRWGLSFGMAGHTPKSVAAHHATVADAIGDERRRALETGDADLLVSADRVADEVRAVYTPADATEIAPTSAPDGAIELENNGGRVVISFGVFLVFAAVATVGAVQMRKRRAVVSGIDAGDL